MFRQGELNLINDADFQDKTLLISSQNVYYEHKIKINKLHVFSFKLFSTLIGLKIYLKKNLYDIPINISILRNIVEDCDFEYEKQIENMKKFKELYPNSYLSMKSIWNLLNPKLYDPQSFNTISTSNKNLQFLILAANSNLDKDNNNINPSMNDWSNFVNEILEIEEIINEEKIAKLLEIFSCFELYLKDHFKLDIYFKTGFKDSIIEKIRKIIHEIDGDLVNYVPKPTITSSSLTDFNCVLIEDQTIRKKNVILKEQDGNVLLIENNDKTEVVINNIEQPILEPILRSDSEEQTEISIIEENNKIDLLNLTDLNIISYLDDRKYLLIFLLLIFSLIILFCIFYFFILVIFKF